MTLSVRPVAECCALILELLGVLLLTVMAFIVLMIALKKLIGGGCVHQVWRQTREQLGRSILLGLELLVTADIIQTVAVEMTYQSVLVLSIIVIIRTFLSFTLEVELTGNWPWQNQGDKKS